MPRALAAEWIGKNDDTPVPPRVRLRVLQRFGRRCDPNGGCGRPIRPGDKWTCDHRAALINGGRNRELNLRPLCEWCDTNKTAVDVAEKSKVSVSTGSRTSTRSIPANMSSPPPRAGRRSTLAPSGAMTRASVWPKSLSAAESSNRPDASLNWMSPEREEIGQPVANFKTHRHCNGQAVGLCQPLRLRSIEFRGQRRLRGLIASVRPP